MRPDDNNEKDEKLKHSDAGYVPPPTIPFGYEIQPPPPVTEDENQKKDESKE